VKKRLIQLAQPVLSRFGLRLRREKDDQRLLKCHALLSEIVHQRQCETTHPQAAGISFIIFSKDRALQLDGLLQSMLHHVTGTYSVHVLYYTSSKAHYSAYQDVTKRAQDAHTIQWTQETNFHSDLVSTLKAVETESVCFLVDDIVFIRPVDLDTIPHEAIRTGIVSLRLGRNITFCYTKQKAMKQPSLTSDSSSNGLLQFVWDDGNYDWAYPLSVDGHIFPTTEITIAAQQLNYKAPNTFERALQILNPLYSKRPGYCFESPKLVNIPLNRVQDEVNNISGDISPEELLEKWNEGMTLDYITLSDNQTKGVHEDKIVNFYKRHTQ
jgi:hypothetical protein